MGSSMVTSVSPLKDDGLSMPPPKKVPRRGTAEIEEAVRRGEIRLSIPFHAGRESSEGGSPRVPLQAFRHQIPPSSEERSRIEKIDYSANPREGDFQNMNVPLTVNCPDGLNINDENQSPTSTEARIQPKACNTTASEESVSPKATKEQEKSEYLVSTRFSDVVGHGAAKLRLEEVLLPLALPRELADAILTGIRSSSASIMLVGPPGCGKTQLARAIAGEAQAAFLSVGPSDVLSKYVGESESAICSAFDKAYRRASKMESKTAVLFFDEIDALGQSRGGSSRELMGGTDGCSRRVLAELLIQLNRVNNETKHHARISYATDPGDVVEMHAAESSAVKEDETGCLFGEKPTAKESVSLARVIVVAATNRPEDCDSALIRRFAVRVMVGLPSQRDRKKILQQCLRGTEHTLVDKQLNDVAMATDGWSGSDLENLTREAAMAPVRECIRSAALEKRRAHLRDQQSGDSSCQDETGTREDAHEVAKQQILERFQNLRPVSAQDFDEAILFWAAHGSGPASSKQTTFQNHTLSKRSVHYDTSSDEED